MPVYTGPDYSARLKDPSTLVDDIQGTQLNKQALATGRANQLRTDNLREQEVLETDNIKLKTALEDAMVFSNAAAQAPDLETRQRVIMQELADPATTEAEKKLLTELSQLDYSQGTQAFNNLGSKLYQEGITRGFIDAPAAEKPVSGKVVEVNGRKVLIDPITGNPIRDLGAAPVKGPGVTINTGNGSVSPNQIQLEEMAKTGGSALSAEYKIANKNIGVANKVLPTLRAQKEALSKIKDETSLQGKMAPILKPIRQYISALTGRDEELTAAELSDGLTSQLLGDMRVPGTGDQAVKEMEMTLKKLPQDSDTPAAAALKVNNLIEVMNYKKAYSKAYKTFYNEAQNPKTNPDMLPSQYVDSKLEKWFAKKENQYKSPYSDMGTEEVTIVEDGEYSLSDFQ